ncbi:hypothetical protein [Streptomyces sp. NBC_01013]|uniref:hypothetical protein n=1 Tax=Streptomyces sp. NBC_01013 TaxID=2903718 RepID=UPI00386F2640|nr:hypothetical protein OG538_36195 [Streptomyces sp. NBC_01013]
MTSPYIDSPAVTVREQPRLRSSAGLPRNQLRRQVAELMVRRRGVPLERMAVTQPADNDITDGGDFLVIQRALAALGPQEEDQTLYLVCSGPLLDPLLAPLAAAIHNLGWRGDELGISHLEEQGGTQVFGLLAWTVPQDAGATVESSATRPMSTRSLRARHTPPSACDCAVRGHCGSTPGPRGGPRTVKEYTYVTEPNLLLTLTGNGPVRSASLSTGSGL